MQSSMQFVLPEPTYRRTDPNKKSHARKQPEGHIPRPRNAFILFRCDIVRQQKIPSSVETDHRNISRIVGKIWRQMSDLQKEPWVRMAHEEKDLHSQTYPQYRFSRASPSGSKPKPSRSMRGKRATPPNDPTALCTDELTGALSRAASCPPGAPHTPLVNVEASNGYRVTRRTRDDLERRRSRVVLYRSRPPSPQANCSTTIKNEEDPSGEKWASEEPADDDHIATCKVDDDVPEFHYPIPDIDVSPEWENNAPTSVWHSVTWRQESEIIDAASYTTRSSTPYAQLTFTEPFSMPSTLPPIPKASIPCIASDVDEEELYNSFLNSPRAEDLELPPLSYPLNARYD